MRPDRRRLRQSHLPPGGWPGRREPHCLPHLRRYLHLNTLHLHRLRIPRRCVFGVAQIAVEWMHDGRRLDRIGKGCAAAPRLRPCPRASAFQACRETPRGGERMRSYQVYTGLQDLGYGSVESAGQDLGGPFFVQVHSGGAMAAVEPVVCSVSAR